MVYECPSFKKPFPNTSFISVRLGQFAQNSLFFSGCPFFTPSSYPWTKVHSWLLFLDASSFLSVCQMKSHSSASKADQSWGWGNLFACQSSPRCNCSHIHTGLKFFFCECVKTGYECQLGKFLRIGSSTKSVLISLIGLADDDDVNWLNPCY